MGGVRNLGIDKSARTVHIGKNMSRCKSDLYIDSIEEMVSIAMYHLRISNFTEPPVGPILDDRLKDKILKP